MAERASHAVVFVHGLARKPAPEKLKEIWQWALSTGDPHPDVFPSPNQGLALADQGIEELYTYYADVFYDKDYETEFAGYYENLAMAPDVLPAIVADTPKPGAMTPREARFKAAVEAKLGAVPVPQEAEAQRSRMVAPQVSASASHLEIASWLPGPVKQALIRQLAMEAYYFLFDKQFVRADGASFMVRQVLRRRLLDDLAAAGEIAEKIIIVSHSMGTMIAYDVLRNCPECPQIDTLYTLGSPLGVTEIQDELQAEDTRQVDFPANKLVRWVNVFDRLDPVCGADPILANDYAPVSGRHVEDLEESNWGSWRHTITHYFAGSRFRSDLASTLGIAR